MRSGESTPQMSFDLDRNTEDKKNTTTNESLSRRKMLRQNSDSGFSGFLKKFDQATDFTKRVSRT